MSVYEGITHLSKPGQMANARWNYAVLGFAVVFESISWLFGWKAFRSVKGRRGIIEAIHKSKDPSSFMSLKTPRRCWDWLLRLPESFLVSN